MRHPLSVLLLHSLALLGLPSLAPPAAADPLDGTTWRLTLLTRAFGPVDTYVDFSSLPGGGLRGASRSGAGHLLAELPGAPEAARGAGAVLAFELQPDAARGGYSGRLTAPAPGTLRLALAPGALSGRIEDALLAGEVSGVPAGEVRPLRDYPRIVAALDELVRSKLFAPGAADSAAYQRFHGRLRQVAAAAVDDLDLLLAFEFGWTGEAFSHFDLRRSTEPVETMLRGFDDLRVGYQAAELRVEGEVAVLRVDTMMGNDTIEQITAAYAALAASQARALIIDLRGNGGGAFAVKPLVEHVIDRPLDAGYFLSRPWYAQEDRLPRPDELAAVPAWSGWSILSFWRTVQDQGLLRVRFEPAEPNFDGPVFVLVDGDSASATELAADALRASGAATLVGEATPGNMLSQSPFPAGEGFVIFLPVADYVSAAHGRIEGVGVPVDVAAAPAEALEVARRLAGEALAAH